MKIIFTFHIQYKEVDTFGSIDHCTETEDEAIALFIEWCIVDNWMLVPGIIENIEVVYNIEDA